MIKPDFILLYVDKVPASVAFYSGLLGSAPVEESPDFAMYSLSPGLTLGLWARHDVQPAPMAAAGGSELAFTVKDAAAADALHRDWSARGIPTAQKPVRMDFGYTFVSLDPDGHRLRVFAPGEA